MSIEAMKQALAALQDPLSPTKRMNAITSLLQAIAEAEKQEPVAWMVYTQDGKSVYVTDNPTDIQEGQRALPLYTHPPKREWLGLTDEEIKTIERNALTKQMAILMTQATIKEKNT